ncbi:MAG: ATP-dependent RNA helicase HrpA, partial [SAR86 cluster bacterium]
LSRAEFTDPEIRRTNLASVILKMLSLGLGDIADFPFLEIPENKAINDGFKILHELNAIDSHRKLTKIGRQMGSFPVDPKYARMLIAASENNCLQEMLIICSALSGQDPREIPQDKRQSAMEKLKPFSHEDSDFMSFVKLWHSYEQKRQEFTQSKLRKYCSQNFLSFTRMREWRDTHRQLVLGCQKLNLKTNNKAASYEDVHLSILVGSLNQVASLSEPRLYQGSRNRKFNLLASSVIAKKNVKWIVSGDLIETTKIFASMAAKIDPQWIIKVASHLLKRNYFEPHFSVKRQEVMAYEKVILFGLVITERALVSYSKIDPVACRELFIESALSDFQLKGDYAFMVHNRNLIEELARQEEKMRRPNAFFSERGLSDFYGSAIPDDVCNGIAFRHWYKQASKTNPQLLKVNVEDLDSSHSQPQHWQAFPDATELASNKLVINYLFEPGNTQDGATVDVPEALIYQLTQADIDWAVPGIIKEKCTAYIKSLPKALRKQFIPVSAFVNEATQSMTKADGGLLDALLLQIRRIKGLTLNKEIFNNAELAEHLQVKVRVLDARKQQIAFGYELTQICHELKQLNHSNKTSRADVKGQQTTQSSYGHDIEQQGLTRWSFDCLPEKVTIGSELVLVRYPCLVDKTDSVAIELSPDPDVANQASRQGLMRLYMLSTAAQKKVLFKQFKKLEKSLTLKLPKQLTDFCGSVVDAVYVESFDIVNTLPRDSASYEKSLLTGKAKLISIGNDYEKLLNRVFDELYRAKSSIRELSSGQVAYVRKDINAQLDALVGSDFIRTTAYMWLREFPRYFQSIGLRVEKMPHPGKTDLLNTDLIDVYWQQFIQLQQPQIALGENKEITLFRWMIEEFRVSLFSQSLRTKMPVSAKRLDKQFEKIKREVLNR